MLPRIGFAAASVNRSPKRANAMGQCPQKKPASREAGTATRESFRLNSSLSPTRWIAPVLLAAFGALAPEAALGAEAVDNAPAPWWVWPIALFSVTLLLGIVAILGGVGGGVLFVPIVSGFFPFHLDFVRGAGLLLALCGALSAGPSLLRGGMASMRLALPLALVGSITSIFGALVGLALPASIVQTALGLVILGIVVLMLRTRGRAEAAQPKHDALARALQLHGIYYDPALGRNVEWQARNTVGGLFVFAGIGVLAGLFGLGAGWANVPALNLLMGVPLKLAAGTSSFLLSVIDTSAAWIYLNRGAMLPMLVVPSCLGMMIGARIGARLLRLAPTRVIRQTVLALLLFAGARALLKGLGLWT